MALSSATVFEVRTTGNDTNGGGFVTGASGTDYSQTASKRTGTGTDDSTTDAVANGTTTITSATANFQSSIVGNIIYLQGGTGALAAGWYQVTVRTNATTITVDRTVAAGTGITMNIGGAFASPGGACVTNQTVGGLKVWIQSGTYTVTSTSSGVANGVINKSHIIFFEGYNATRGDLGTPPEIKADGVITSFTFMTLGTAGSRVTNIKFNGNSRSSGRGLTLDGIASKCLFYNFTGGCLLTTSTCTGINCYFTGNATVSPVAGSINLIGCVATANTITPFVLSGSNMSAVRCISYANTGASTDGFVAQGAMCSVQSCVAYGNGRDGFRILTATQQAVTNCIAEGNSGTGFNIVNVMAILYSCAAYNNTTANFTVGTNTYAQNYDSVTGTGSFFTNAASGDFSLNNTASAGAAARAVGSPATFPGGLTTNYLDIGAAQHQDSGGGGGSTAHASVF